MMFTLEDLGYERHGYGDKDQVIEYVKGAETIQFYTEQNIYHAFASFSNGKVSPMRMDMRTTYAILNTMKMLGMKP